MELRTRCSISEEEGNLPIGYRMARGADRFSRQGSALAHTFLADLCELGLPGIDWDWALVHMHNDLRRGTARTSCAAAWPTRSATPSTWPSGTGARRRSPAASATGRSPTSSALGGRWVNAFDPGTGLLRDSAYYEGGKWNYSFRLLHDMAARIDLAGGDERLRRPAGPLLRLRGRAGEQPGEPAGRRGDGRRVRANRFEGLNNEPDMEAPWAYHYAGRPDRTAEVVHAVVQNQFGTGRGGLPGNDDSGGLCSWYVWASLGLFPVAGQNLFLLSAPAFAAARIAGRRRGVVIETSGHRELDRRRRHGRRPGPVRAVGHLRRRAARRSWLPARAAPRRPAPRRARPRAAAWGRGSVRRPLSDGSACPHPDQAGP